MTKSSGRKQEKIDELFQIFTNADKESQAQLFGEINKEFESFLSKENNDKDSTDGILDFLDQISDSVQEEFDKLLSGDSDKKRFVRALSKRLALLLNTKVDTVEKIKRIIKIAIETTLKIWQEQRQLQDASLHQQGAPLKKE